MVNGGDGKGKPVKLEMGRQGGSGWSLWQAVSNDDADGKLPKLEVGRPRLTQPIPGGDGGQVLVRMEVHT